MQLFDRVRRQVAVLDPAPGTRLVPRCVYVHRHGRSISQSSAGVHQRIGQRGWIRTNVHGFRVHGMQPDSRTRCFITWSRVRNSKPLFTLTRRALHHQSLLGIITNWFPSPVSNRTIVHTKDAPHPSWPKGNRKRKGPSLSTGAPITQYLSGDPAYTTPSCSVNGFTGSMVGVCSTVCFMSVYISRSRVGVNRPERLFFSQPRRDVVSQHRVTLDVAEALDRAELQRDRGHPLEVYRLSVRSVALFH